MLTKVKIVYATNTTNDHVNVWVKNIGINPILDANKTDVYYGEIGQAQYIPLNTSKQLDETWWWDGPPLPDDPLWQISDTFSINITDLDLRPGVTYEVSVTTPNGVTDEQIFSVLGN